MLPAPAVLSPGVTIVVSPLLALIQDQVEGLLRANGAPGYRGVPATWMSSNSPPGHNARVLEDLNRSPAPLTKLLYVTPEMLAANQTLKRAGAPRRRAAPPAARRASSSTRALRERVGPRLPPRVCSTRQAAAAAGRGSALRGADGDGDAHLR